MNKIERNKMIFEDKVSGFSYRDVGKKYDISAERVRQIVFKEVRRAIDRFRVNYPVVFESVCRDYLYKNRPDISRNSINYVMDVMTRRKRLYHGFYTFIPLNKEYGIEDENEPYRVLGAIDNFEVFTKLYDTIGGYLNAMKYAEINGFRLENDWYF